MGVCVVEGGVQEIITGIKRYLKNENKLDRKRRLHWGKKGFTAM